VPRREWKKWTEVGEVAQTNQNKPKKCFFLPKNNTGLKDSQGLYNHTYYIWICPSQRAMEMGVFASTPQLQEKMSTGKIPASKSDKHHPLKDIFKEKEGGEREQPHCLRDENGQLANKGKARTRPQKRSLHRSSLN